MFGLCLVILLIAELGLAIDSKFRGIPQKDEANYETERVIEGMESNYKTERMVQSKGTHYKTERKIQSKDADYEIERKMQDNDADYETERVVKADDAENGMFPWMAALYKDDNFVCSASIISETAVLTAAHCVNSGQNPLPVDTFHAVIGHVNRYASNVMKITFSKTTSHPRYVSPGLENDVAILETTQRIKFNDKIKRICLAHKMSGDFVNEHVKIMGWGFPPKGQKSTPRKLQYDDQMVVSNERCPKLSGQIFENTKICVIGLYKQLSRTCSGDSGGPVVYYKGSRPIQVGIVSHNSDNGCRSASRPAAYNRISAYIDFIKSAAVGICFR